MKENKARIRYDRDELEAVMESLVFGPSSLAPSLLEFGRIKAVLDEYENRRREGKDKACQSQVFHGPGHQSSTFCEVRGKHDMEDGKTVHMTSLPSGGFAEWTDDDPYE